MENQFPGGDLTSFSNLAAFTSHIDSIISASPRKSIIGAGYLVWTNGAANIGCPWSGPVFVVTRNTGAYAAVLVIDAAQGIAMLKKDAGTWASAWKKCAAVSV